MIPIRLRAAISIGTVAALAGCASNPGTGGTDLVLVSESEEIKVGREMHEEMAEQNALYPDPEAQAYIDRIGQTLAKHSDRPDIDYTFSVLDSEIINAFVGVEFPEQVKGFRPFFL